MSNQDNGGTNNTGITPTTGKKQKGSFIGSIRKAAKKSWVWLTTSKAGKVAMGLGTAAVAGFGAKIGYDSGFKKGAASVKPEVVYLQPSPEEDEEPQDPEEEVVEETAE